MKALVLTGVKKFEIQNMPTPQIEPDEVLINTAYAGVCGTAMRTPASSPRSVQKSPTSRSATAWPSIRTSTAASANSA